MSKYRFLKGVSSKPVSLSRLPSVLQGVVVTEKSTMGTQESCYTFRVDSAANKRAVKQAVEHFFNVNVLAVNTLNVPRRKRRFKGRLGYTAGFKKAMVTLKKGQTIETGADAGAVA